MLRTVFGILNIKRKGTGLMTFYVGWNNSTEYVCVTLVVGLWDAQFHLAEARERIGF